MKQYIQGSIILTVSIMGLIWISSVRGWMDEDLAGKLTLTLGIIAGILILIYKLFQENKKNTDKS